MTPDKILLVAGCGLLVVGILGGEVTSKWFRILASICGMIFIVVGIVVSLGGSLRQPSPGSGRSVSGSTGPAPTQGPAPAPTQVPAAQKANDTVPNSSVRQKLKPMAMISPPHPAPSDSQSPVQSVQILLSAWLAEYEEPGSTLAFDTYKLLMDGVLVASLTVDFAHSERRIGVSLPHDGEFHYYITVTYVYRRSSGDEWTITDSGEGTIFIRAGQIYDMQTMPVRLSER